VRPGAVRPMLSSITGPTGTGDSAGGSPIPRGTSAAISPEESGSHSGAAPAVRLSATSASRRALADSTSTIQGSMRSRSAWVNAIRFESGDQRTFSMRADSGRPEIARSSPLARSSRRRPEKGRVRLRPRLSGEMRVPARRSSGSESSAIEGRAGISISSRVAWSGLRLTAGVVGASTTATNSCDGTW
jgi:hypothetical protein